MMSTRHVYNADAQATALFQNNMAYCIGTGRMGLALQEEYQQQMRMVQEEIGFSHIRGHGLFCDDVGIYWPVLDQDGNVVEERYNFTYLDRIFDNYLKVGLRPFLELGFMPKKMASGTQTIFYWEGNTTPPKDHDQWARMIKALLLHLCERYGREEVVTWPVEVWNEPNLRGFWENADLDAYLKLYDVSVGAVKEVLPQMRVGGPAVCGGSQCMHFIRTFLEHCRDNKVPVDFVSRHIYMGQEPHRDGRYLYHAMNKPEVNIREAEETRELIDSFPELKGYELHITEYNTSYNPFCPTHDTVYNAALIAGLLAKMGDTCASYSYWTFGDVFEEMGIPDRVFHGGFGLVANGLIRKPTFWTFEFFKRLEGKMILREEDCLFVKTENGSIRGVMWNLEKEEKKIEVHFPGIEGKWGVVTRTVDMENGNPLRIWHEMGEPASLTRDQLNILLQSDIPHTDAYSLISDEKGICVEKTLMANAVVYVEITSFKKEESLGYHYPGICE